MAIQNATLGVIRRTFSLLLLYLNNIYKIRLKKTDADFYIDCFRSERKFRYTPLSLEKPQINDLKLKNAIQEK